MMGLPSDTPLTAKIAQEVCQRADAAALLEGSIAQIGTQYTLVLKAVNCANGELLASTEAQANGKNHVLDALDKATSIMRNKLGESLSTVNEPIGPSAPSRPRPRLCDAGRNCQGSRRLSGFLPAVEGR